MKDSSAAAELAARAARLLLDTKAVLFRPERPFFFSSGWASPVYESGPVRLDSRSQTVTLDGQPVELTAFEYRVLECLLLRAGEVISKSELTDRLYDQDFERDSNVIEVFVGRLRRKLDPDGMLKPIETLRGRGYRWSLNRTTG